MTTVIYGNMQHFALNLSVGLVQNWSLIDNSVCRLKINASKVIYVVMIYGHEFCVSSSRSH